MAYTIHKHSHQSNRRPLQILLKLPLVLLPSRLLRKLSPRQRLFVNVLFVAFILLFIPLIITALRNPESTEAWFNDQWAYRQTVPVSNSASTITNAQFPITVDTQTLITDGKMRSDCKDIRIVSSTGKLLKHWVHQCNSATTRIYAWALTIPSGNSNFYLYYGNPSAAQNTEVKTGTAEFPGISCKTILDHNDSSGNGTYTIDPNAGSPSDKFTAYCDMSTDSGGWTIVVASNGTTNQQGFTSNTEVSGNPFSNASYNTSTQKKQDVSLVSSESLIRRSTGVWLKANVPLFDANLTTANQHPHNTNVTLTANDGTQVTTAVLGYSNYNNAGGGDFGITTSVGFDHHSTSYYHLRSGCTNHYFYKYGTTYNVNTALGSWTQTAACSSNSTAMGAWYAGMRGTNTPALSNITISSPTNEEQSPGPVAYWRFDEGVGTTAYDSSIQKYHGTINGATWKQEGECLIGKCLYFDGVDDYIDLGNSSRYGATKTTGAYTIEAWVKPVDVARYNVVTHHIGGFDYFSAGRTGGSAGGMYAMVRDATNNVNFWPYSNTGILKANEWNHVVFIFEDGVGYKYYLNGKLDREVTNSDLQFNNYGATAYIGYGTDSTTYFKGFIDEVKIYPYVRTPEQVKADFGNRTGSVKGTSVGIGGSDPTSSLSNGLVGYWKMDETTANSCSGGVNDSCDSSGNGNDAAWNGDATASSSGKYGHGTTFDGTGDYIITGDTISCTLNQTVSVWLKGSSTGGNRTVFEVDSCGGRFLVYYTNTGGFSFYPHSNSNISSSSTYADDKWHHLVVTTSQINSTQVDARIYVNGQLDKTQNVTFTSPDGTAKDILFGSVFSANTNFFKGTLDDARIYNRALSPAEVSQLYNFAPGPVAYYDFEEKSGTTANDKSGNGFHGTLTNGPRWTQGKFGGGIKFDGTNDYLRANTGTMLNAATEYTIGFWLYAPVQDSNFRQILSGSGTGNPRVYFTATGSTGIYGRIGGTTDGWISNGGGATNLVNKWRYVAISIDSTGSQKNYVDGILVNTRAITDHTSLTLSDLYIGSNGSGNGNFLKGTIDEFRIYNYARTQKQIIEDMNAGHPAGGSPVGSQVVYLKMDEGYGTTANNTGNTPTLSGSINGPTWSNEGKFGKALNFDGTDDYVQIADNAALDLTSEWTIGGWFRPDETTLTGSDRQVLISKWQTSAGTLINYYLWINTAGKAVGTVGNGSASQSVTSTTTLSPNNWYHIMATFNGTTGNLKIYINGKNEATTATGYSASYANTGNVRLGQYDFAWSSYRDEYNGLMDEVKIYGSALTDEQVKIDYNRNASLILGAGSTSDDGLTASSSASRAYCIPGDTSTCSPPIGEWKFDEKTGTTASDTSGNGYTGTFGSQSKWARGKIGSALNVDGSGVNSSVSIGDNLDLIGSPLSISVWVYPRTHTNLAGIVDKLASGGNYRIIQTGTSGLIQFGIRDSVSTYQSLTSTSALPLNQWSHIYITYDNNTTGKIYINGKLDATKTDFSITRADIATPLRIGYSSNNAIAFNGLIDDVRIYNYARTPAQIAWDYNRGAPVARWKMDECQGSTLNDASGNGLAGTITIGATGSQTSVGTCSTSSTAWGNGATGKFNSSLNFDGTDDYFEVSQPNIPTSPNTFTVTGWIKPGAQDSFFITPNSNGIDQFITYDTDAQRIQVGVAEGGDLNQGTFSSRNNSVPNNGTWTHFAVSINNREIKIYINGRLDSSGTHGYDIAGWTGNWRIGQRGNSTFWYLGQMDDLQVFPYVLTATQIRNVMNQGGAVRFGPSSGTP